MKYRRGDVLDVDIKMFSHPFRSVVKVLYVTPEKIWVEAEKTGSVLVFYDEVIDFAEMEVI